MTNSDQINLMARRLQAALSSDEIDISHSKSLELAARILEDSDRNTTDATTDQTHVSAKDVKFMRCSPILRIFDEKKAREFYCDFLGFRIVFEHRFSKGLPLYLGLERGGLSLHLSEHHGDASPGANVFVLTANIREFHRELIGKNYAYNRPGLEKAPWGTEMQVHDPFGNRIRFCQQDE